jgi:hypothetical protein
MKHGGSFSKFHYACLKRMYSREDVDGDLANLLRDMRVNTATVHAEALLIIPSKKNRRWDPFLSVELTNLSC